MNKTLKFGEDFVCTNFTLKSGKWSGKPVFIGFGIGRPETGWDYYKDFDVKGKMLIGFTNEPGQDDPSIFNGNALTWFGRWVYKYEEAAKRGAIGMILIHNDKDAGYSWDVVRNSWTGDTFMLADDKNILPLRLWITGRQGEEVATLAGYTLKQLRALAEKKEFYPITLDVNLTIESKLDSSINITGIIPGSDPALKNKAIVFSSHYDHFGIGREINGDKIYNGALDNGTALATLLALAEAYGKNPELAKMTLIFTAVDLEEEGMLGSIQYTRFPPFSIEDTVANINLEMSNAWGTTKDMLVIGAEKSELLNIVKKTAEELGLKVSLDRVQEYGFTYRSDQLSFARAGIPSTWLDGGYEFVNKEEGFGEKIREDYRLNDYHKPTDEIKNYWDYSGLIQLAEFTIELVKNIEKSGDIRWNINSEFQR
jgi:hypothetical protein